MCRVGSSGSVFTFLGVGADMAMGTLMGLAAPAGMFFWVGGTWLLFYLSEYYGCYARCRLPDCAPYPGWAIYMRVWLRLPWAVGMRERLNNVSECENKTISPTSWRRFVPSFASSYHAQSPRSSGNNKSSYIFYSLPLEPTLVFIWVMIGIAGEYICAEHGHFFDETTGRPVHTMENLQHICLYLGTAELQVHKRKTKSDKTEKRTLR
eukprot:GHVT01039287.1.p1 GENE.GHVT01039287.1~~GHVT01039287.1.p1  ORF type:complete len:208 (+),score=14.26 GHVT01039287.1:498-1121(+)